MDQLYLLNVILNPKSQHSVIPNPSNLNADILVNLFPVCLVQVPYIRLSSVDWITSSSMIYSWGTIYYLKKYKRMTGLQHLFPPKKTRKIDIIMITLNKMMTINRAKIMCNVYMWIQHIIYSFGRQIQHII